MANRIRNLARPLLTGVIAITSVVLLGGCAEMADNARGNDLCAQYGELVTAADEFRARDTLTSTVDEMSSRAEHFRDELNQVQAVADGRLDTAITNLEATLDDLRQATIDKGEEYRSTVAPLWQDDMEQIAESWAVLQQAAATQCAD
jgi:hypothetical protein